MQNENNEQTPENKDDAPAGEDQSQEQTMEVHHHPHAHGRKKFKEYLLEFFMIFLAVTMGFLAESLREHIGDKSKEHEYIESLVTDLRQDTGTAARSANHVFLQIAKIDTLEQLLALPNLSSNDSAITRVYNLSLYVADENSVNFDERTISQLISSGNMRLITKEASDSIMDYFIYLKDIEGQRQFYIENIKKCMDAAKDVYDFAYMQTSFSLKDTSYDLLEAPHGKRTLIASPRDLARYATTVEYTKRIIYSYMWDILRAKARATKLLAYLQREYE